MGSGRRFILDGSMVWGGGGLTFLNGIVPWLARLSPDDSFRVFVRNPRCVEQIPALPNLEIELLQGKGFIGRFRFTTLRAPRIARSWKADLLFSFGDYAPPWSPCPVIASCQNPNVFTELDQGWVWYDVLRLRILRALAGLSARRCARILFVSQDSARWMGDAIGLPEGKRLWLHHGLDLEDWGSADSPGPAREQGPILSVSSIYRYKNYLRLMEAYALLLRRGLALPDLLIAGDDQDPEYYVQMKELKQRLGEIGERIHFLEGVPYEEIRDLYAAARLFVFPSYLETFGIPLIEALASGLPVVASDIPVFREIAADAPLYVDPHDTESIAGGIERLLFDDETRQSHARRSRQRAREFSWERSARKLLGTFDEVLAGS
ncbi:MAG: glycosyltransferase family 4 protein [Deltaproteobacteria bacterium]|nr:glycosyltransferase family 4 protein [Deltaproteobacteria bacterium]MBW2418156.1 glycosyltransferase family 4 protein [Deltaproteobacteria bacterium]